MLGLKGGTPPSIPHPTLPHPSGAGWRGQFVPLHHLCERPKRYHKGYQSNQWPQRDHCCAMLRADRWQPQAVLVKRGAPGIRTYTFG